MKKSDHFNHRKILSPLKVDQKSNNPQDQYRFKTQFSPSNKSDSSYTGNKSKYLKNLTNTKTQNLLRNQIQKLIETINIYNIEEKRLKEQMNQMNKQNTELTSVNQLLRTQLFNKQHQLMKVKQYSNTLKQLQQQSIEAQKAVIVLQSQIKRYMDVNKCHEAALNKYRYMLSQMQDQNEQLTQINTMDQNRCKQLTLRIKQYQDAESKSRKKIRQLQNKSLQKVQKDSNASSSRIGEKQNQILKERIRILSNINERKSKQIDQLHLALDNKKLSSFKSLNTSQNQTSSPNLIEQNLKTLTEQNQQLKKQICQLKQKNILTTSSSKQMQEISKLQQQISKNKLLTIQLKQQIQYYSCKCEQLQQANSELSEQNKQMDEKLIKYFNQINNMQKTKKEYQQIKNKYELLQGKYMLAVDEIQIKENHNKEIQRKNKQVFKYSEQLREDIEKIKCELIQTTFQFYEYKMQFPKNNEVNKQSVLNEIKYKDQKYLYHLLEQRNISIHSNLQKFKQIITDQIRLLSLELTINQTRYKTSDTQQLIKSLKIKVDRLLQLI